MSLWKTYWTLSLLHMSFNTVLKDCTFCLNSSLPNLSMTIDIIILEVPNSFLTNSISSSNLFSISSMVNLFISFDPVCMMMFLGLPLLNITWSKYSCTSVIPFPLSETTFVPKFLWNLFSFMSCIIESPIMKCSILSCMWSDGSFLLVIFSEYDLNGFLGSIVIFFCMSMCSKSCSESVSTPQIGTLEVSALLTASSTFSSMILVVLVICSFAAWFSLWVVALSIEPDCSVNWSVTHSFKSSICFFIKLSACWLTFEFYLQGFSLAL